MSDDDVLKTQAFCLDAEAAELVHVGSHLLGRQCTCPSVDRQTCLTLGVWGLNQELLSERKSSVAACVHCFAHKTGNTEFEKVAREDKGLVFQV